MIVSELVVGVWQYMFDVAGLGLGFAVALLFAAVTLDNRIVGGSLVSFAVYAAVHFVYQVLHFTDSAADRMGGVLILEFLLAVGLLPLSHRLKQRETRAPARPSAAAPGAFDRR
ncbi:hypothetical protein [Actinoplanes solisilvae]|uniref:hypothetical protein n=1 Tax=Actinoplanes solisilvae TaxID=2486853 RepID=UPI000FD81C1B|nr:hypothetical protein [Actinoplanes solisilvae]